MSGPEVGVMLVIDRLKDKVTAAEWDEIVEVAATFVYVERVRGVGGDWWFDVIATSDDVPTGNTPVQYGELLAALRGADGLGVERGIVWRRGVQGWEAVHESDCAPHRRRDCRQCADGKIPAGARYPRRGEAGDFHLDLRVRAGVAA
jgi:hypothetical protein